MLADFGLACSTMVAKEGCRANFINSEPYRPPELVVNGRRLVHFGCEVDVWALGATAYDVAAFGNKGQGQRRLMMQRVLDKNLMIQSGMDSQRLMAGLDQGLQVLAPDDGSLKAFVARCASSAWRRPSAQAALQELIASMA